MIPNPQHDKPGARRVPPRALLSLIRSGELSRLDPDAWRRLTERGWGRRQINATLDELIRAGRVEALPDRGWLRLVVVPVRREGVK